MRACYTIAADETAIVVGGAGGIGGAVASRLRALGVPCTIWDTSPAPEPSAFVDAADPLAVDAALREVEQKLGPPTMLVHAAGGLEPGGFDEVGDDAWSRLLRSNLDSARVCLQTIGGSMRARRRGSIVVVASDAALTPRPAMAAYGATKAAVVQLSLAAAIDLASSGVRCNVVCPGATDTPMQRSLWNGHAMPASVVGGDPTSFRGPIPRGRIATPEEIAGVCLALLSDDCAHVIAQTIAVDGGAGLGR